MTARTTHWSDAVEDHHDVFATGYIAVRTPVTKRCATSPYCSAGARLLFYMGVTVPNGADITGSYRVERPDKEWERMKLS